MVPTPRCSRWWSDVVPYPLFLGGSQMWSLFVVHGGGSTWPPLVQGGRSAVASVFLRTIMKLNERSRLIKIIQEKNTEKIFRIVLSKEGERKDTNVGHQHLECRGHQYYT